MNRNRIPRHWLLIARRGEGKSTFAAAMDPDYLTLDLDGRWAEQDVEANSHVVTDSDPLKLVDRMESLRQQLQGKVNTIVFDSGTAVLDFIQARGRLMEEDAQRTNQKFNKDNINRMKADTMRVMRLAALRWHCDVLWIFHIEDGQYKGKDKERTTISAIEMERMKANLNAVLTIVTDNKGKRGIRIEWSRYHSNAAAGHTIWDDAGMWKGVPEKISQFIENFQGTEGFNGNTYSSPWLLEFLKVKGAEYPNVEEMKKVLGIQAEPQWWDRNGWAVYIKKALPEPK